MIPCASRPFARVRRASRCAADALAHDGAVEVPPPALPVRALESSRQALNPTLAAVAAIPEECPAHCQAGRPRRGSPMREGLYPRQRALQRIPGMTRVPALRGRRVPEAGLRSEPRQASTRSESYRPLPVCRLIPPPRWTALARRLLHGSPAAFFQPELRVPSDRRGLDLRGADRACGAPLQLARLPGAQSADPGLSPGHCDPW